MDQALNQEYVTVINRIVRGNGHGHYVIETEDKDAFLAAGFVVCGTVSEDCKIRFVVRQKGDHEVRTDNNLLYRSEGQDTLNSENADPTGPDVYGDFVDEETRLRFTSPGSSSNTIGERLRVTGTISR